MKSQAQYNIHKWDFSITETSSIKQLNEWVRAKPRNEYIVPTSYIPKTKVYHDTGANSLTESIGAFFKVVGGFANRINTTGQTIKNKKGESVRIKGCSIKGTSDLIGGLLGITFHVEVKFGSDRQSPEQKAYQRMVQEAGHVYIIARNFDGFAYQIKRSLEKRGVWKV